MRCRECFVRWSRRLRSRAWYRLAGSLRNDRTPVAWCELIADHVADGASAEYVRKYLQSVSRAGWQLVNWLTHSEGVTNADAILAVELIKHVLGTFGNALFRHARGIPDRCPRCNSYRIGLRSHPKDGGESVPGCQACGWIGGPRLKGTGDGPGVFEQTRSRWQRRL